MFAKLWREFVIFANCLMPHHVFVKVATLQGAAIGIQFEYSTNPWQIFTRFDFCHVDIVKFASLQGAPFVISFTFSSILAIRHFRHCVHFWT